MTNDLSFIFPNWWQKTEAERLFWLRGYDLVFSGEDMAAVEAVRLFAGVLDSRFLGGDEYDRDRI